MRITESSGQAQFAATIDALEESIAQTQNQISSGQSFTTASENPVAAGNVNDYQQALAQSQQHATNAASAATNLNTEDSSLADVQNQLQTLRSLTLEAGNGALSSTDRAAIATQAVQIQNSLLALANTTNGAGEYIFSGYSSETQAFTATASGAVYNGDQGQRLVQIGAGLTVADGDSGATVFNQIPTGNGSFTVAARAANSGSALIGAATVTDPTTYVAGTYNILFSDPSHYTVTDSAAPPNTIATGTYSDGGSIAFLGRQIAFSGTPAAGDSFTVAPSAKQSLFATVQSLVNTLQGNGAATASSVALSNSLGGDVNNLDRALTQIADVRASVGGRLNLISSQQTLQTGQQTQLQQSITALQGLDYASAITTLDQQNTTLSAALQAFTLTRGLSLFKFI